MTRQPRAFLTVGIVWLGLGLVLVIVARVSFVLAAAYHEGEIFTSEPLTDAQRIEAAKAKIIRTLNDPRSAQFGKIFVSSTAGSPAICGTVTSKSGLAEPQTRRFVVKDGDMFFNQNDATTHNMWMIVCRETG